MNRLFFLILLIFSSSYLIAQSNYNSSIDSTQIGYSYKPLGSSFWMGEKPYNWKPINKSDFLDLLRNYDESLYADFRSGHRITGVSYIIATTSVIAGIGGYTLIKEDKETSLGLTLLGAGVAGVFSGIMLEKIGKNKTRKAVEGYKNKYNSSFNLNYSRFGMSLTYKF